MVCATAVCIMKILCSRLQEERDKIAQMRGIPKIDPQEAAVIIQKVVHLRNTYIGYLSYLSRLGYIMLASFWEQ